jgi:segregation and condensation protein B
MVSEPIDSGQLKQILEAALLAADEPLSVGALVKLFRPGEADPETIRADVRAALKTLAEECAERGVELKRVASGYRYQVRQDLSPWISRLWEEKPPRYTRALLETLALIAYRQPVTRGDIEQVRGVSVSQNIMRTLLERGWIRVVGQREVPGRPSLYGTTREFLDYFNLKSLEELPPLAEIRELIEPVLVEEALAAGVSEESAEQSEEGAAAALPDEGEIADNPEETEAGPEERIAASVVVEVDDVSGSVDETEDDADADQAERHTAEVVQLPTAPH